MVYGQLAKQYIQEQNILTETEIDQLYFDILVEENVVFTSITESSDYLDYIQEGTIKNVLAGLVDKLSVLWEKIKNFFKIVQQASISLKNVIKESRYLSMVNQKASSNTIPLEKIPHAISIYNTLDKYISSDHFSINKFRSMTDKIINKIDKFNYSENYNFITSVNSSKDDIDQFLQSEDSILLYDLIATNGETPEELVKSNKTYKLEEPTTDNKVKVYDILSSFRENIDDISTSIVYINGIVPKITKNINRFKSIIRQNNDEKDVTEHLTKMMQLYMKMLQYTRYNINTLYKIEKDILKGIKEIEKVAKSETTEEEKKEYKNKVKEIKQHRKERRKKDREYLKNAKKNRNIIRDDDLFDYEDEVEDDWEDDE